MTGRGYIVAVKMDDWDMLEWWQTWQCGHSPYHIMGCSSTVHRVPAIYMQDVV